MKCVDMCVCVILDCVMFELNCVYVCVVLCVCICVMCYVCVV